MNHSKDWPWRLRPSSGSMLEKQREEEKEQVQPPTITRLVGGVEVEFPVEEVWG